MYAKEITREYLEELGVTIITPDGLHIYKGSEELEQIPHQDGYLRVNLYDKKLYDYEYPLTKSRCAGSVVVGVHRAVYAWYHGSVSSGMVVDHIDDNKTNNNITNLQLLTPGDNIWKYREHKVYLLKCKLNKPRKFYEDKLNYYKESYEAAKDARNADLAHKRRSNISQLEAKLRYWDLHNNNNE